MAHTTTLRAQGATRASDARLSFPVSSRASIYFIWPCFPSAIHGGKTCNSPKSRTGAMPQRSNPASRAHCLMRVGRSENNWAVARGEFSRGVHSHTPRGYHCGVVSETAFIGRRRLTFALAPSRGLLSGRGEVLDPVAAVLLG